MSTGYDPKRSVTKPEALAKFLASPVDNNIL